VGPTARAAPHGGGDRPYSPSARAPRRLIAPLHRRDMLIP
jgi:hypothetical protein